MFNNGDYVSELYKVGFEETNRDQWKYELFDLPTDQLKSKYDKYLEILEEVRENEPPKKRKNKSEYRSWVARTQDLIDLLNTIAEEIQNRNR